MANKTAKIQDNLPKQPNICIGARKRLFENSCRGSDNPKRFEQGLSMKDLNYIANGFRQVKNGVKLGKGDIDVQKWNTIKLSPTSTRRFVEMEDGRVNSAPREMIIREDECGLKEPKPLRFAEMKRVIWLCRGPLASPRVRERAVSEPLREHLTEYSSISLSTPYDWSKSI